MSEVLKCGQFPDVSDIIFDTKPLERRRSAVSVGSELRYPALQATGWELMRNCNDFGCRPGCSSARRWVLGAVLVTFAVSASAGIFRDVMEKIGISKPPPQTTAAGGVPTFPRH